MSPAVFMTDLRSNSFVSIKQNCSVPFQDKNKIKPETIIMPPAMGNMSFQSIKRSNRTLIQRLWISVFSGSGMAAKIFSRRIRLCSANRSFSVSPNTTEVSGRFEGSGCFPNVNDGKKKNRTRNSDRQTVKTGILPFILSDEVILIKSIIPFDISTVSAHSSARWVFRFSYLKCYREWGAVRIRCTLPSRKIT